MTSAIPVYLTFGDFPFYWLFWATQCVHIAFVKVMGVKPTLMRYLTLHLFCTLSNFGAFYDSCFLGLVGDC